LRDYGFPATLFVYTDFIGGKKALSWEQIQVLAANGIDIQSKTLTHRNVARLEKEESFRAYFQALEREISSSKKIIEQKLKKQCKYLAYPYGETNTLVVELLKKYGYRAAFTVKRGSNPFFVNNYMIKRSIISGEFDMDQFKKNLAVFNEINLK
jgi:peptidoglycan/xylan/chitin deacetylase (PgdA/CDA1 family)